jgi:uncharacterized protein YjbJ (UPF0337 family)
LVLSATLIGIVHLLLHEFASHWTASSRQLCFAAVNGIVARSLDIHSRNEDTSMNEDRIAGTAENLGGKVEADLGRVTGDVKSQVEGKMTQAAGAAQELYGQARDTAEDAVRVVRKQASSLEEMLRDTIETRPYTAVAVALAVGFVVGRMGRSY